jgi:hypothetical protein
LRPHVTLWQNLSEAANLNQNPKETMEKIIHAIESVELELLSKGRIFEAIERLNEIDKEYPGQYLTKISLVEAYLMSGDKTNSRRFLFLASNLKPTDSRYELLAGLINGFEESSSADRQRVIQKIERKGVNAFHYFMGLAHYLDVYHNQEERQNILLLLAATKQSPENTKAVLEACEGAGLSKESVAEFLNGSNKMTPKIYSS